MATIFFEAVGWVGGGMILLAYFLLTHRKIGVHSNSYHLMNLFGGLGVGLNAFMNGADAIVGLNIVWVLIAIYGIMKGLKIFKK